AAPKQRAASATNIPPLTGLPKQQLLKERPLIYFLPASLMLHLHAEHREFDGREHLERAALDRLRGQLLRREAEVQLLVLGGADGDRLRLALRVLLVPGDDGVRARGDALDLEVTVLAAD